MTYYNTTNESGAALKECRKAAKTQEDKVLALFKEKYMLTPSDAHELLSQYKYPITSVRRSITNLTKDGKLIKTFAKIKGPLGRNEYCWALKDKP